MTSPTDRAQPTQEPAASSQQRPLIIDSEPLEVAEYQAEFQVDRSSRHGPQFGSISAAVDPVTIGQFDASADEMAHQLLGERS